MAFARSLRANPAVDGQRVTGDVTRLVGQEPHHRVGDLVWLADSPHPHESGRTVRVAASPFCYYVDLLAQRSGDKPRPASMCWTGDRRRLDRIEAPPKRRDDDANAASTERC